jgi:hypothetical protein
MSCSCGGRSASGTCCRFTRTLYQSELDPRIPSTSTSAGCSGGTTSACRDFHSSSASSASGLVLVRATSMSGITDCRRPEPLPPRGAFSAGPSSAARARSPSSVPTASSMPVWGSPNSAKRSGTVGTVNCSGLAERTSSHVSGVETRASGSGLMEYADATVRSFAFWLKSTNTLSPRSSFHHRAVASRERGFRPRGQGSPQRAERRGTTTPARCAPECGVPATRSSSASPRVPRRRGPPAPHTRRQRSATSRPRHRIEVHPQFVRVVEVLGAHRMRIEVEAAKIHHPRQARSIADDSLLRRRPRRVVQRRRVDEIGMVVGHTLLEERLRVDALRESA